MWLPIIVNEFCPKYLSRLHFLSSLDIQIIHKVPDIPEILNKKPLLNVLLPIDTQFLGWTQQGLFRSLLRYQFLQFCLIVCFVTYYHRIHNNVFKRCLSIFPFAFNGSLSIILTFHGTIYEESFVLRMLFISTPERSLPSVSSQNRTIFFFSAL